VVSVYQHLQKLRGELEKAAARSSESVGPVSPAGASPADMAACIDTLVRCSCLKPDEREVMKEALRGVPPIALDCMTVLAKHADQQAMAVEPIGSRITVQAPGKVDMKKLAEERYREASRRLM
jgi:hypothetical protein